MTSYIQMKKRKKMEKYKKFMIENKKDFLLPHNLSPKEKDIFMYIFQLLRKKLHRGIYPEAYNNEIIYTKSDVKSLILKEIVLFKQYKKGWIITINPSYITKNVECPWCGAKFNEKIYFRLKRMRCPSCMYGMNGSTVAEKFEEINDVSQIISTENKTKTEKVTTDIKLFSTNRTMQIARQKIIPFQNNKADILNAISTVNRIAEKKKEKEVVTIQAKILANFSDTCVNFILEYFFMYNHTIFSPMKYMNIGLTEIRKDPRFIANAALKNTVLSEVKTACDELLAACHQINEHTTALNLPQNQT